MDRKIDFLVMTSEKELRMVVCLAIGIGRVWNCLIHVLVDFETLLEDQRVRDYLGHLTRHAQ